MSNKKALSLRDEPIHMNNYFIEDLYREGNVYTIKGWAYQIKDGKMPNLILEDVIEPSTIIMPRPDVKEILGLDYKSDEIGFKLKFKLDEDKEPKLTIKDVDGNSGEMTFNPNEFENVSMTKLKDLIAEVGIRQTLPVVLGRKKRHWIAYDNWFRAQNTYNKEQVQEEIKHFKEKPLISIVMPVYNIEPKLLRKAIRSVLKQEYTNWELCIADDNSTNPRVRQVLSTFASEDSRIKLKFRKENGHIAQATNSAINLATGEYIAFMDDDDELNPLALYEYVKLINEKKDVDLIYSDEDFINYYGFHYNPFFKSNWNPRLFLSHNFITHFVMVKASLLEKVGGLRSSVNGAQDYDFLIRALSEAKDIYHVPKILYHWRTIEGSVAENPEAKEYAYVAGQKALQDHFDSKGIEAIVNIGENVGTYSIERKDKPEVSIIIVNDPRNSFLSEETLIKTLVKTDYDNFEIIAVNFNQKDLEERYPEYFNDPRIKYTYINNPVTINELYQFGAKKANNDLIAIVKSGIQPFKPSWLDKLVNETIIDESGMITPLLLDPDARIISAGFGYDYPGKKVYYPGEGKQLGDLGYFFRTALAQNIDANHDLCYVINKEDFLNLKDLNKYHEPLAGLNLSNQVYKSGKNVVLAPEALVTWHGEFTPEPIVADDKVILYHGPRPEENFDFIQEYPEPLVDYTNDIIKRYRRSIDPLYEGLNRERNV